jgi:acetyl-CoA C-acetyltransferase
MGSTSDVVICAFARTPVGKYRGALRNYSAIDLGIITVKELLSRSDIEPNSGLVDELIFGQVLQAGSGQAPARQVAIKAGLPVTTAAYTVNKVCGSALKAVMLAANSIKCGENRCIVAGGMESMTNAPKLVFKSKRGEPVPPEDLVNVMIHDGLWDVYNDVHMGNTGEIVAKEFSLSREVIDEFSVSSHKKAHTAWENGWFDEEAFSISGVNREGNEITLERDEGIRGNITLEKLSEMNPAFLEEGVVTAGNASQLSDGASAVLVTSAEFAEEHGLTVYCTIRDYVTSGVEPERVMAAPIPAIQRLLERNNLNVGDVDIFEHNEAFASASCAVLAGVGIPKEKLNLHGGAVSMGHPLGSSGTRCLITMFQAMRRVQANKGIVSLCLGGGNAVAMLVEL